MNRRRLLGMIAIFVVAPIAAVVMISTLLLLGVKPHYVFLPGLVVRSKLDALGLHTANRVAVLSTAVLWWAIVVFVWLGLRRLLRRTT